MRALFGGLDHGPERSIYPRAGRFTRYALYVAVVIGLWGAFKQLEPLVWSVVEDFEITHARAVGPGQMEISGTFKKVRDCEFKSVFGYSGKHLIRVKFHSGAVVSRVPRSQYYGPWTLTPKVSQIELYARHRCTTGDVLTKLFDGAVVL